jgi:hypothetical protein
MRVSVPVLAALALGAGLSFGITCLARAGVADRAECVDYKGFASVWFDMRVQHDNAFQYQSQMIDSLGTGVGDRDITFHHSAEYKAELRRLLSVVTVKRRPIGTRYRRRRGTHLALAFAVARRRSAEPWRSAARSRRAHPNLGVIRNGS